ncbi:MAG: tyrosine-type recombinase/integrase [Clostridia bacterium]|nr:tyrosine-type recombinase/integrase [Clostridia bacterium]
MTEYTCKKCSSFLPEKASFCPFCGSRQTSSDKPQKTKSRGNGQGTAKKRGKTWTAIITVGYTLEGNAIRRSKGGFKTKKEALEYIPILRENKPALIKTSSLQDIWAVYETSSFVKLSKSKQTHYRTAKRRLERIFNFNIKDLGIADLQNIVDTEVETYYPAKDMRDLLSILYERAIAEQLVTVNLAKYIVLPELNETETVPFTEKEILKLWEDYSNGFIPTGYFLLMIYTGMMPGELLRLRPEMIDIQKRVITGCGIKTKKRKETAIVIPEIIIPLIETLLQSSTKDRFYPDVRDSFYSYFSEMIKRTNCNNALRPYSCRHTTATLLANKNISPAIIQEAMRHAKITTTQRYIHINTDILQNAIQSAVNTLK